MPSLLTWKESNFLYRGENPGKYTYSALAWWSVWVHETDMGEIQDRRREDEGKVRKNQVKLAKLAENCLRVMTSPYSFDVRGSATERMEEN